ncbi:MAG: L-aspartate oxidase [Bdellovibrionales bacterium]|nr:L-aspartate oxidase [Bdellovibrionales bacterium]
MPSKTQNCIIVIGSGIAGLYYSLRTADKHPVILISKTQLTKGNSLMAQGGIAAAIAEEDSFERHIEDTLSAGAGLCHEDVVNQVVHMGPMLIQELENLGVHFTQNQNQRSLHKEGGHSTRRILHVDDMTGAAIHKSLLNRVIEHPNIEVLENHIAIDLITKTQVTKKPVTQNQCLGVYVLDIYASQVKTLKSNQVVLATGGAGKTYLYTSNWSGATGDGIAMAWRAGCRIANLEFMQFHPTCLYHANERNFLISEAIRGEGAQLINHNGDNFTQKYHKLGDLAPRDIVARAIDAELKKSGKECVYLNTTLFSQEFLLKRFPNIYKKCLELGIKIDQEPIPVVPAAHYLCGGILADSHGQTDLKGLFALGETAFTGLHGANRLASNSLLECLAYSYNASQKEVDVSTTTNFDLPAFPQNKHKNEDELSVINHLWDEVRRIMWNYVGIVRTDKRLHRAKSRLKNIIDEAKEYYQNFHIHPDIIELRNITTVADLTVDCALRRKESRGIHFNLDYPNKLNQAEDTILYLNKT